MQPILTIRTARAFPDEFGAKAPMPDTARAETYHPDRRSPFGKVRSQVKIPRVCLGLAVLITALIPVPAGAAAINFVPNRGQLPPEFSFSARGRHYAIDLAKGEALLGLNGATARMKFVNAGPDQQILGGDPQTSRTNYLIGNDPSRWLVDIPGYARVTDRNLYPGIDLVYYGTEGQLEYDLIVSPRADPSTVRAQFTGFTRMRVAANGDLVCGSRPPISSC